MKDKKTILLLLVGILLGVTIMGGVVCFAVSKVKLVDKTYAAKVNNSNEETQEATKEVLHEAYSTKIAKEELYKKEVSDYLYNEQYSAVEKSLREKEAQDMKEQYEDYATGLADGTYTREESGKKDKAFNQTFKDNEKISKDGVKTKSAADEVWDNFKKWHDEQKK